MTIKIFLFLLITWGAFGSEDDEVLSVMEGDSVTLNINLTVIQGFNLIQWRFGGEGSSIARTDGNEISYGTDERFRDRLQLNQTGSLTIKNTRTKHSGLYKLQIDHSSGTSNAKFFVAVYESPSVLDAGEAEMKSVSVKEGESVTLHTDVTELHGDELIVWRFGGEGKLIAKSDLEIKSSSLQENTDGIFRDRLQLNDQTGSLTINNMIKTDSGLYRVKISSSKQMINKRFIVTVSGSGSVSPGAIAGIVVVFLLVILIVVFYHRRKLFDLKMRLFRDRNNNVIVKEGEDVTLHTDAEIQPEDEILWTFEGLGARIAEIKDGTRETFGGDGRFTDRLMLDETGSLTIRNIEYGHDGDYKLHIKHCHRRKWSSYKIFTVTVNERAISVIEGDDLTLNSDTELNKDKQMKWLFGDQCLRAVIAEISGETGEIFTYEGKADGRFRNRLKLDYVTGSLTIKNTGPEHSGFYELQTEHGGGTTFRDAHKVSATKVICALLFQISET